MTDEEARQIAALMLRGFELLSVREGDIIVIRTSTDTLNSELMQAIAQFVAYLRDTRGLDQLDMLTVPADIDVRVLDAQAMKALGWVRSADRRVVVANSIPNAR